MGYVSTEKVKEVRNEIKKVLSSKEGFKVSVTRPRCGSITVALMQSPIEFPKGYDQVNHYYFMEGDYYSPSAKGVLSVIMEQIENVMGANIDRNAGDLGADYCDMNYYVNLRVGKWDKECKFIN